MDSSDGLREKRGSTHSSRISGEQSTEKVATKNDHTTEDDVQKGSEKRSKSNVAGKQNVTASVASRSGSDHGSSSSPNLGDDARRSDEASNAAPDDAQEEGISEDNPLGRLSQAGREGKVKELISLDKTLQESKPLLTRAVVHAASPDNRVATQEDQHNLSEAQKTFLIDEEGKGLLDQSKYLIGSLLATCLAGMIQGWTQSAINGSNIGMTERFNIDRKTTGGQWMFGFMTAVPFLVGGVVAPLISDPLQEHLFGIGRRGAMALACAVSIGATIGQASSHTRAQLIGCRILTGITLAAKASAAPLLTAEVAPNHLRGNLLATWQLSDAFGIFLGFASNLAVLNLRASTNVQWRVQTLTPLIPTVALLLVIYLTPESPRFLMKRGKFSRALESFILLRPKPVSEITGARDLVYAHFQLERESEVINEQLNLRGHPAGGSLRHSTASSGPQPSDAAQAENGRQNDTLPLYHTSETNYFKRLAYFWRVPRARRALTAAATAMLAQQLTGINTIAFLSATLLQDRQASERSGAWVGFGLGLTNFIFGLPAFWLGDTIGRATLLLLGFPPMFLWMLLLAISFETGEQSGSTRPVLFGVFGFLFVAFYSPTAGTSPFAISAEVFPLVIREVGQSLAVAVNFVFLGLILLVFPKMTDSMGGESSSLGLFAGLNVLAFILCFMFVPETKGRTLEELQYTFGLPTRLHIRYRFEYIMKWLEMRFALELAHKLHLLREVTSDREAYEHRTEFWRWGREQISLGEGQGG